MPSFHWFSRKCLQQAELSQVQAKPSTPRASATWVTGAQALRQEGTYRDLGVLLNVGSGNVGTLSILDLRPWARRGLWTSMSEPCDCCQVEGPHVTLDLEPRDVVAAFPGCVTLGMWPQPSLSHTPHQGSSHNNL